ncbi:protein NEN1-like [Vigna unguiculata]|uniref:DNA polymerase III subunit epsilon n=1 Tax=Vigna unguiculata TaxID=3917 RepID=A0A4D6KVS5_VIGUN|nr:protein NEN1-like [Vigna unguiculata]QCD80850.1 DNA polymerase III subunit epsilon [Vigna unguiculata]
MGSTAEDRSEIVFFDVETSVPTRTGQGFAILEFGAILVCPKTLTELRNYSTLIRPADLSVISPLSQRCNGITADAVATAPTFADIAHLVYDLLHGRIWAGHNIIRFDCVRIRDAFAEINQPPPEPKGTIDSLVLLTQKFGRRAGDMKMATLATYFGLGRQTHRSLDDVRMNLEVLKYCATVLFLESSLPDIFTANSWVSPNTMTRSRSNGKSPSQGALSNINEGSVLSSPAVESKDKSHPIISLAMSGPKGDALNNADPNIVQSDPFNLSALEEEIKREPIKSDVSMVEKPMQESPDWASSSSVFQPCSTSILVLEPDGICVPSIDASLVPSFQGSQRIELLHEGFPFQLHCTDLKVRFGISTKFFDTAGRPRLNFVVDSSPSLCNVLDACDHVAQKLTVDSGSSSDWRPVVIRKEGFFNYPTVRLHIPTAVVADVAFYATEIYQKESSGAVQRLLFSKFDAAELGSLFMPGTFVDAFFSLDPYDYQQNAGIKLVAKKLIIHCK